MIHDLGTVQAAWAENERTDAQKMAREPRIRIFLQSEFSSDTMTLNRLGQGSTLDGEFQWERQQSTRPQMAEHKTELVICPLLFGLGLYGFHMFPTLNQIVLYRRI